MSYGRVVGLGLVLVLGVAGTFGLLTAYGPVADTSNATGPGEGAEQPSTVRNVEVREIQRPPGSDGGGSVYAPRDGQAISDDQWTESLDYRNDTAIQFRERAAEVGLSYRPNDTYSGSQEFVSNSGAYVSDYDGDGWTDLLLVGGERPVLYHNENGTFERSGHLTDVTRTIQSAVFFDYDRDGDDDLLLLANYDRPVFFENDAGEFRRRDIGLPELAMPYGGTAGDFDGDGCPDLFLIQYGDWREATPGGFPNFSTSLAADTGMRNRVFDGDCSSFAETTERANVRGHGWSLATSSTDFDGDGDLDVYVANDFNHDVVYLNRGDGTFERRQLSDATNRNGMSAEITDVNGDGRPDVFVTNVFLPDAVAEIFPERNDHLHGNTLLVNSGNGSFTDRATEYGVRRGGMGWAASLTDFDNDGDDDLVHATRSWSASRLENEFQAADALLRFYRYPLVRERVGDEFVPVRPDRAGLNKTGGRGLANFDYDRDGDRDLLLAPADGRFRLYENVGATGNALQVTLRATDRSESGATVTVTADGTEQTGFRTTETDLLSQDTRTLHFGVGSATSATMTVTWPGGTAQRFDRVRTGQRLVVSHDGIQRRLPFTDSAS